jgi:RNA polymerase sigma factor (sigma-70 family)
MGATRSDREDYGEYRRYLTSLGGDNSGEQRGIRRRLGRAIGEELTPRQREFTRMYFADGLTMTEIAADCGVNVSTVSRTLSRAKARLRKCLRYGARELLPDGEEP